MDELLKSASRLLWCYRINEVTGHQKVSLSEWLSKETYAPSVRGDSLVLNGFDSDRYRNSLAADIGRLACAGSESLINVASVASLPKSVGWQYVKLYYSAFFYASAMLRVWGVSMSYFRTLELQRLKDTINAYSLTSPFSLQTGQFRVSSDLRLGDVVFEPITGSQGAHDAVWKELRVMIDRLRTCVAASALLSADKVRADTWLDAFRGYISKGNSNVSWLSQMRNDVHYRQISGLWFPYSSPPKSSDLCLHASKALGNSVNLDAVLDRSLGDIFWFRNACLSVIAFGRLVISDLFQLGGPKSFLKYGQVQMELQVNATTAVAS